MILGVIADDFTGASDIASMLVRAGLRTVQTIGLPEGPAPDADAVVVALKSRTAPVDEAVRESLAALAWLRAAGAQRFYFKYCSTFDSTAQGNIGPVTDAMMNALGTDITVMCPALPENGRTVYAGHLFVGDVLLSESGMRNHPLTPMTDANLQRVLQPQVPAGQQIGLVRHATVVRGANAVRVAVDELRARGVRYVVTDAVDNNDLRVLAEATDDLPLVTGGSGLALGMPAAGGSGDASALPSAGGHAAVLSGSCSLATQGQVERWISEGRPSHRIDPMRLEGPGHPDPVTAALAWAESRLADGPVLIYATSTPEEVRAVQAHYGVEKAGQMVEGCLARIAKGLVDLGVRRLVTAGGETSGAVVKALDVDQLRIGPTIDPGVPWTWSDRHGLLLAMKSGNFGGPDFFAKALGQVA